MISIDFKKDFESIEHEYLIKILQKMRFGPQFIKWIEKIYTNSKSAIMINGYISKNIDIEKGIRQGDALSMMLLCLAIQPLLIKIENEKQIIGITGMYVNRQQKVAAFADDITLTIIKQELVYKTFKYFMNMLVCQDYI